MRCNGVSFPSLTEDRSMLELVSRTMTVGRFGRTLMELAVERDDCRASYFTLNPYAIMSKSLCPQIRID